MKKISAWKTKGMNRDLSVSAFNPEFSFENMNLRLATNEGNTLLSWVNEKSTGRIQLRGTNVTIGNNTIPGSVVGTAVLNNYLVLFVHNGTTDYIYRLIYNSGIALSMEMDVTLLYSGNLGFSTGNPLETLSVYEKEDVQKVYWTDGKNQPRVINIKNTYDNQGVNETYNPFDFVPELQLGESVYVTKLLGASGMFAPGVIQYALTYYNKYGQESNIFYTSPLLYISHRDRGGSPEEKVENAFKIRVTNPDLHFDFIRIYSIHRTSLNGTPVCKRVQDISLEGLEDPQSEVSYIDSGTSGETIDPTELLYKGGEEVAVGTMSQKDETLFMGDINITRSSLIGNDPSDTIEEDIHQISTSDDVRQIYPTEISKSGYVYENQLTAENSSHNRTVPCGGFKRGDYYRLGLQFQYKNGKWSDPFFINGTQASPNGNDVQQTQYPQTNVDSSYIPYISLPIFKASIPLSTAEKIIGKGYKKVRPVVVFPELQDRVTVCQGVVCPTLYTINHRNQYSPTDQDAHGDIYAQSSWFFRAPSPSTQDAVTSSGAVAPAGSGTLPYTSKGTTYDPSNIRQVEIWGDYDPKNQFTIDRDFLTLHSPDIEFDDRLSLVDFSNTGYWNAGLVHFSKTFADMELQTETPTISNSGGGFVHRPSVESSVYGIVSGPFYDDYIIDEDTNHNDILETYPHEKSAVKWMVHLWHKNGSLNNDINRPVDKGNPTAVLRKKVVSNLRFADTTLSPYSGTNALSFESSYTPKLFDSNVVSILRLNDRIYQGNIDTLIMPDKADGNYFAFDNISIRADVDTKFTTPILWKTFSQQDEQPDKYGCWYYDGSSWSNKEGNIGDKYINLVIKKEPVRIKYKSTPHIVFGVTSGDISWSNQGCLSILDIVKNVDPNTIFGGKSEDALKENIWIPCGEPVTLSSTAATTVRFEYGDTYFQRWDCLKTYPFTKEDPNQVVEIGSFMLETRVNIDGRYDRNRGQANNLNMSPENFNLLNPVYSQTDNFFSYKIQDRDYYTDTYYPNQIAWSKTRTSGSDVDAWTNVTLGSSLEMDGDKGKVTKLARLNDKLLCFQDKGISQILYNENVQISSTDGVPIEIANSNKVMGKRYISNTIGCSNKWTACNTPSGIYFMDSNEQSIYLLGDGLKNLSQQFGFNSWCKNKIPTPICVWNITFPHIDSGRTAFVTYYDKANQDVLFINKETALAWNEKLGAFTSFYDYGDTPFFCSLADTGIWVKANGTLWKHQAGSGYCEFFGVNKPYWMTFVGNPEPQMDKIFTNMEFRACVEGDGELSQSTGRFTFTLPFNSLETWNEYQHGYTTIENKSGHSAIVHDFASSSLKRKFRIWRCDIPRNNVPIPNAVDAGYSTDVALGISRYIVKPNDRMRNPWLYLKLFKAAAQTGTLPKVEIHDLVMTYFD